MSQDTPKERAVSNGKEPAFPAGNYATYQQGITMRDWFATFLIPDNHEIDAVSDCDDQDLLERFGTEEEKEEGFAFHIPNTPMKFRSIQLRKKLEAKARAELRYIEADAMIEARNAQ